MNDKPSEHSRPLSTSALIALLVGAAVIAWLCALLAGGSDSALGGGLFGLTPIPTSAAPPTSVATAPPLPTLTAVLPGGPSTPVLSGLSSGPRGEVDYGPMLAQMNTLISLADYDVGVAFVDIGTMQAFSLGREGRFHAMSTFKGPLAAYYLWLIEQGVIEERPNDHFFIEDMLTWSSNPDATCMFERVGGIAGFNDWLADQGLSRENNFVFSWNDWYCLEGGQRYAPESDFRYRDGDPLLGLPGDGVLLECPNERVRCDKAFAPIDLAMFYARLYRGEVLSVEDTNRWLAWMEKPLPLTSMFDSLPEEAQDSVIAYAKNGFYPADEAYPMNFYHEAGILQTPYGAFAMAVFMQGNPHWRGTEIHGELGRIAYVYFMQTHGR